MLVNHLWSYAGEGDRPDVNQTFVPLQLGKGWSTSAQFESTYDRMNSQWTKPESVSVGKVLTIGKLPVSLGLQGRYWLEGPNGAPEWDARFSVTFVLPE